MRSIHPENQRGPRPAWSGAGFIVGGIVVMAFVLLSDGNVGDGTSTTTSPTPTISIDDLRAMLTDSPGEAPLTIEVDTPDGPVRVVVPTTTEPRRTTTSTSAPSTTSTTTTAPPTTTVPRTPRDPGDVMQDFLEDLGAAVPTTTEVVDG